MSGSMRCTTPHDVILLLKSSEFIAHDLTMAFVDVEGGDELSKSFREFELVLRNWITVNPSNEFRCFVRDKQLLGTPIHHASIDLTPQLSHSATTPISIPA